MIGCPNPWVTASIVRLDRRVSGLPMGKTAARVDRLASKGRPPCEWIADGQDRRTSGSTCEHITGRGHEACEIGAITSVLPAPMHWLSTRSIVQVTDARELLQR